MAPETMTVADYTFQIARAEITGSLQVDADDGTNLREVSPYSLNWVVLEARGAISPP